MPTIKKDFDLLDRGWVNLYVKKCESLMEEFTSYVYALQTHCAEERHRSAKLDKDNKELLTEIVKINAEKKETRMKYDNKFSLTPEYQRIAKNKPLDETSTGTDADRTALSDGSPAFLNMAMGSEQLQIETTCILSPGQHREELFTASEQLSSPKRLSTALDSIDSIFQYNTSPTCKSKSNNENKSALGFLKARGRVGKNLIKESRETKLREHNSVSSEKDFANGLCNSKGKLQPTHSDWLGKNAKSAVKRCSTGLDDIQRKRALLSLNKNSDRKLRQSRLTQIVAMRQNKMKKISTPTSSDDQLNIQQLTQSPKKHCTKKQLSFTSDTDDIFHFSSDDDEGNIKGDKVRIGREMKQNAEKPIDATFLHPLPTDTDKSESVLAISPTAPPIICLDESECNQTEYEKKMEMKSSTNNETNTILKDNKTISSKRKIPSGEKLAKELAAAMLAEWEEEADNEEIVGDQKPVLKFYNETTTKETKPRVSQLPIEKISIKQYFNIDCDECQKYVDFMGSNMNIAEIEAHLRRCTRHRMLKDNCIHVTPPGYWNPLMPSFSESDPRNKTLLEDPFLQRKRK